MLCKLQTGRTLSRLTRRHLSFELPAHDFQYFPDFFSLPEQHILLGAALEKLDSAASRRFRRRKREFLDARHQDIVSTHAHASVQTLFLPDAYYDFEEGHFDRAIKRYREMHLTSWPDTPGLSSVLDRLHSLLPSQNIQTHILHLASDGEIFPHIDNAEASGSWILGVSLGSTRVLRLESPAGNTNPVDIPLSSGSVYIQRDSVRYTYRHSVLRNERSIDSPLYGGQRLSIMIRDCFPTTRVSN